MKQLILVALLLAASACATRQQHDPLLLPPEHDLRPDAPAPGQ